MDRLSSRLRRTLVILTHLLMVAISNQLAFEMRFDSDVPAWASAVQWRMLPWLLLIRGLTFVPFKVYHGLWRYVGIWDLRNILASVTLSSVIFYLVSAYVFGLATIYPRSVFIIDTLVLTSLCGGLRLATRTWLAFSAVRATRQDKRKKVLIFGAGEAGEMIARDIRNNAYDYTPVGFVDDDRSKVGQSIHGVSVLGTRKELGRIIAECAPDEVLIAM